jgi:hypothetical protein
VEPLTRRQAAQVEPVAVPAQEAVVVDAAQLPVSAEPVAVVKSG